jgi:hypothetical protein
VEKDDHEISMALCGKMSENRESEEKRRGLEGMYKGKGGCGEKRKIDNKNPNFKRNAPPRPGKISRL